MADPLKTMNDKSVEFNSHVTWLCNTMRKYYNNDYDLDELQRLIRAAKAVDEHKIIELCGPYLFKYKNQLEDENNCESFFMNDSNVAEIDRVKKGDDKEDQLVYRLVKKTREYYSTRNADEKETIRDKVLNMLSTYIAYLLATKQANKQIGN